MIRARATVRNGYGIHCRPSGVIAREMAEVPETMRVLSDAGREADPHSVLSLMGLGLLCGQSVTIEVEGPDEKAVCERLVELFERDYDFKR